MDVKRLRYFIAVAEELHFGRAARRLFMSQPPLSQQIKILEEELGVLLFERDRRSVRLTPAGTAFLAHAQEIMRLVPIAVDAARQAAVGERGDLRIVYSDSAMFSDMVLTGIAGYRQAFPMVNVELREASTLSQLNDLMSGRADVGFVRGPLSGLAKGLRATAVACERLVVAVPVNHPLAKRACVSLKDLSAERFVALQKIVCNSFNELLADLFQGAGIAPNISLEATGILSVLGLVGIGVGISIMPANIASANFPNVAFVDIEDDNAQTVLYAIAPQDASPAAYKLLKHLAAQADEAALSVDHADEVRVSGWPISASTHAAIKRHVALAQGLGN